MKSFSTVCAALFGVLLLVLPCAAQTAVPPPNDNFTNRMVLTGQAVSSTPVKIDGATLEGLERGNVGYQTVWYTWTAPQDGIVTVTDVGTTNNSLISVFTGSELASLVLVNNADTSLSFYVKAGFAYQICIGTNDRNRQGSAVLNINNKATTITAPVVVATPGGTNDNFASAVSLTAATVSAFTYALEATREGQEPTYTGNQTVWWTWTAPADAVVTMNTVGSNFNSSDYRNRLSVFNGTALTNLTLVAYGVGGSASVSFPTKAGSSYSICVGAENTINSGTSSDATNSVLNITTAPLTITAPVVIESLASANDNFANAQDLGQAAAVSGFGFNGSATTETMEPAATGTSTLWWTWTAPQDGNLTANGTGTDFYYLVTAVAGSGPSTLTELASFGNYHNSSSTAT